MDIYDKENKNYIKYNNIVDTMFWGLAESTNLRVVIIESG